MALIYPQNGDLTKSLKSARKKVPQSARLSAGGGAKAKRAMPKCLRVNLSGASLILSKGPQNYLALTCTWKFPSYVNHGLWYIVFSVNSYMIKE